MSGLYDYSSAKYAGINADRRGKWPSRDEKTGLILKSEKHPTFPETVRAERQKGYVIYRNTRNKRLYSFPKGQKVSDIFVRY